MKINWGVGLVIGMVLFIAFIMFMVVTMMTDDRYDHDLVTEEYYQKDLEYQQEIDAEENARAISAQIKTQKVEQGLLISFPAEVMESATEGQIAMYRPSNEKLDFELPLELDQSQMLIPQDKLLSGRWDLRVSWKMGGKSFLHKESIVY